MPDIWGRTLELGGIISPLKTRLTWGINTGLVALGVEYTDTRPMSILMDVSTGKFYFWDQMPQPLQIGFTGLLSDARDFKSFVETFGGGCGSRDLTVTQVSGTCQSEVSLQTTFKNCRLVSLRGRLEVGQQYVFITMATIFGLGTELKIEGQGNE